MLRVRYYNVDKIFSIKAHRQLTGHHLRDAKTFVETFHNGGTAQPCDIIYTKLFHNSHVVNTAIVTGVLRPEYNSIPDDVIHNLLEYTNEQINNSLIIPISIRKILIPAIIYEPDNREEFYIEYNTV